MGALSARRGSTRPRGRRRTRGTSSSLGSPRSGAGSVLNVHRRCTRVPRGPGRTARPLRQIGHPLPAGPDEPIRPPPRCRASGPARPVVGLLDGCDDLVLRSSLTHHPLDHRPKVIRVRGCRQGSHCDPFACLQGGGNADLRTQGPGPEAGKRCRIEWLVPPATMNGSCRVAGQPSLCEHMFLSGAATILHADVDSFFASVEQRDDVRLRGRPVIVGGWVVLAASYEAKAYGIATAMSAGEARRRCPDVVVVQPRMKAYSEASKAMFEVFDDTSPLVEGLSIDEAFLDVRGMERLAGSPREIAVRLRHDVRERVGLPITVGVARTKFLAKVASAVAKPDGLLVVPPDRELAFLHPLAVERLWGVGPATARKLHAAGLVTVGDVAAHSEESLVALLGGGGGPAPLRARPQRRRAPGAWGSPAQLDRVATGPRPLAAVARGDRRHAGRARRSRHAEDALGRPHRPHGRPAPPFRGLLARHPLAHPGAPDGSDIARPRDRSRASRCGSAGDRTAGPDARRRSRSPTSRTTTPFSSPCRSRRAATTRSIRPSMPCATASAPRRSPAASSLGREHGFEMPHLPD